MKKIVVLLLLVLVLAGCALFRTTDIVVANNSDYVAYLDIRDVKENGAHKGNIYLELLPHTSTVYKLYDNGKIKLIKPNRNFLKQNSNKSYEVLNSPKKIIRVFNKTGEKITLAEANNLFDKLEMLPNDVKDIEVFTANDFSPYAVTTQGVVLQTSKQDIGLIITF